MKKDFNETIAYKYGVFCGFLILIAYGYLLLNTTYSLFNTDISAVKSGFGIILSIIVLFTIPFYIIGCIIQIVELLKGNFLPKLNLPDISSKFAFTLYILYSIILPIAICMCSWEAFIFVIPMIIIFALNLSIFSFLKK